MIDAAGVEPQLPGLAGSSSAVSGMEPALSAVDGSAPLERRLVQAVAAITATRSACTRHEDAADIGPERMVGFLRMQFPVHWRACNPRSCRDWSVDGETIQCSCKPKDADSKVWPYTILMHPLTWDTFYTAKRSGNVRTNRHHMTVGCCPACGYFFYRPYSHLFRWRDSVRYGHAAGWSESATPGVPRRFTTDAAAYHRRPKGSGSQSTVGSGVRLWVTAEHGPVPTLVSALERHPTMRLLADEVRARVCSDVLTNRQWMAYGFGKHGTAGMADELRRHFRDRNRALTDASGHITQEGLHESRILRREWELLFDWLLDITTEVLAR